MTLYHIIESQEHRMAWFGKDHKDQIDPAPVPWAGAPFI